MDKATSSGAPGGAGQQIVVGIDGSPGAVHAAAWAAKTGATDILPILLLFALEPRSDTESAPHAAEVARQHELEARARLAEAAETVRATIRGLTASHGATEIRTEVRTGDAYTVLREAAASARLLVLGSKPRALADASMVTTAALIAHCPCPVVVVRSTPDVGGAVVVAVGSADDSDVIEFAFHQATLRGGRLRAVHCETPGHDAPGSPDVLATWLAPASRRHPHVAVEPMIIQAEAATGLMDVVATSDLLVLGRGTHRSSPGMLGRTGAQVLLRAPCTTAFVGPSRS